MNFNSNNPVTYFAHTNHRHSNKTFGIKRADRLSHVYIIGKTGTGKSTLLETLATQDIQNGEGITVVDPHGSLVDRLAAKIPEHRRKDIIYFNPTDPAQPYRYNPLASVAPEKRPLAAGALLEVFHKVWGERAWGQRMEHILRSALLAMLDQPTTPTSPSSPSSCAMALSPPTTPTTPRCCPGSAERFRVERSRRKDCVAVLAIPELHGFKFLSAFAFPDDLRAGAIEAALLAVTD